MNVWDFGIIPCLANLKNITWHLSIWNVLDERISNLFEIWYHMYHHTHAPDKLQNSRVLLILTYEALSALSFPAFEHAFLLPEMPFPNILFATFDSSLSVRYYLFCNTFPDLPRLAVCSSKCLLDTTTQKKFIVIAKFRGNDECIHPFHFCFFYGTEVIG